MPSDLLTLNEAAQRCDVSVVTLRRAIKAGTLRHAPRRTEREPYQLTTDALEAAGYNVLPPVNPGWTVSPPPAKQDDSRLLSDLEAAREQILQLQAAREELIARVNRAEGELSATRRDFETLTSALTPALNAMADRAPHVERETLTPTSLKGEVFERRRRWWRKDEEQAV